MGAHNNEADVDKEDEEDEEEDEEDNILGDDHIVKQNNSINL